MKRGKPFAKAFGRMGRPELLRDLVTFQSVLRDLDSDRRLFKTLNSAVISRAEKRLVIEQIGKACGLSKLGIEAIVLICQQSALSDFSEVCEETKALAHRRDGKITGIVESVGKLESSQVSELERDFSKKLGRAVVLSSRENNSLVAGLKITVAGTTYDGSLAGALARLEDSLMEAR